MGDWLVAHPGFFWFVCYPLVTLVAVAALLLLVFGVALPLLGV